jgi:hypothetical protein
MFLGCKVFNTSVDKFVEIGATELGKFRQFNVLERIAQFVCNIDISCSLREATEPDRLPTNVSELKFKAKRGNKMFHGMFHEVFHGCFTLR